MLKTASRFGVRTATAAACLVLLYASIAAAVELKLQRRDAEAGKGRVCVVMDSGGVDIAGTQNDLRFDSTCAGLEQANCVAAKQHGKPLHGSLPTNEPSTFRSLVFALDNVDPMTDGDVYCCDFTIKGEGDGCCQVEMTRVGISDPQGVALDATVKEDRVCLLGEGKAEAVAADFQQAPAEPQEAAPSSSSWLWVAIIAAAVLGVLFFALRRAG